MACNETQTNCQPCKDCPPITPPVQPRCNVILADGVFTNSTVTVDNGCIVAVAKGNPFEYRPDANCGGTGGGGGGSGLDGDPGPQGPAGTVAVGSYRMVGYDQPLRIWNTGTASSAVLNFEIPESRPGQSGGGSTQGATDDRAGIEIEDGLIKTLPAHWPPVLYILSGGDDGSGVSITFEKNDSNGIVTAKINASGLRNELLQLIQNMQNQIDAIPPPPFTGAWADMTGQYPPWQNHVNQGPGPLMVSLHSRGQSPVAGDSNPPAMVMSLQVDDVIMESAAHQVIGSTGAGLVTAYINGVIIPEGSTFRWDDFGFSSTLRGLR